MQAHSSLSHGQISVGTRRRSTHARLLFPEAVEVADDPIEPFILALTALSPALSQQPNPPRVRRWPRRSRHKQKAQQKENDAPNLGAPGPPMAATGNLVRLQELREKRLRNQALQMEAARQKRASSH